MGSQNSPFYITDYLAELRRPPSRRRISELAAEFLSAEYQPKKIRLAESAAEFLPP